jgi:hypothetical protein
VRQEYWAVLAGAAETIAIAVAIGVMAERGVSRVAMRLVGAFLVVWFFGTAVVSWMIGHGGMTLALLIATALVVATVIVAGRATDKTRRRTIAAVAVAMLAVELLAYQNHARLARFDPESPTPRYVSYLQQHLDGDRILDAGRGSLYPEWGSALGVPQIETLNVSQLPAYRAFFQQHIVPQHGLFLEVGAQTARGFKVQPTALDLLSVRYIVTDGSMPRFDAGVKAKYPLVFTDRAAHVSIYENRHAFPRAYLSPVLTSRSAIPPEKGFSTRITRSRDTKLLAAAQAAGIPDDRHADTSGGRARVTRYDNTKVRVDVEASQPSMLVLTDTYAYGWRATVNGKDQHLGRVDEVMRGVVVPAGRSTVVFTYRSPPRVLGAVISLLTVVGLLAYAIVELVRRRRRGPAPIGPATGAGC